MFAVGHIALGYLSGRVSSKLLAVDANVSYLFLFSILPDLDLVTQRFGLEHRGPTHSLVLFCLVFLPIFSLFRKKAFPYFVALVQHTLVGDLLTGHGVQLLWPLSFNWYEIGLIGSATSMTNIVAEWAAFLGSIILLFKFKDVWRFVKPHRSNLTLLIPLAPISFTLLAFTVSVFGFRRVTYFRVPTALIIPHLAFFLLFTLAILVDLGLGAKVLARRITRGQA